MKRILSVLLLILSFYSIQILNSQTIQEFKWLNPYPQGNTLRWVKSFSPTNWIAVGDNGTFMKTNDGGSSWFINVDAGGKNPASKQGNLLRGAWFFNANTGLVCGANNWIGRTVNGGTDWFPISTSVAGNRTFTDFSFLNDSIGFVCGYGSYILKTTDAGLTWTILPTNPPYQGWNGEYNCVYALDEDHIYAAVTNNFSATCTGGTYFTHGPTGVANPYDIYFADPNTGIICGANGVVKITTNSGQNWIDKSLPVSSTLYKMHCVTSPARYSFMENFDGYSFPPPGWKSVNLMGNLNMWFKSSAESYSAPASAWSSHSLIDSVAVEELDWLITPKLTINPGDSLVFWLRPEKVGNPPDSLCVRVSSTDTALASFSTRLLYIADGNGYPTDTIWTRYAASLDAFGGQKIYIGFKHQELNGDGIFLDDVMTTTQINQNISIYVGGADSNIYLTTNLGDNWTAIPCLKPGQFKAGWYGMDINNATWLLAGGYGTFNVSIDNGVTWAPRDSRFSSSTFYDGWYEYGIGKVWMVGSPFAANTNFDQVVYSTNGGNSFLVQGITGSASSYRSMCMLDASTGYLSGSYSSIRKTVNGGASWDELTTTIPDSLNLYKIDFIDANTGWVFSNTTNSSGTIWCTIDGGLNWTQQRLPDSTTTGQRIYTADMVDANTGYCVNGVPVIYRTTDGGATWAARTSQVNNGAIRDIYMLNASSGYMCGNLKLFRTIDGWLNVDSLAMPFNDDFSSTVWMSFDSGFVSCQKGMILRTLNSGASWEFLPTSSSNVNKIIASNIDTAYAIGERGNILKFQRGLSGIIWQGSVPDDYFLGQNYPNPFNPVTEFKFGIAKRSNISLRVYDITGRLVETLIDNLDMNRGNVTVKFDGSSLASGVYFYALYVNDTRFDAKKMVLVK